MAARSASSCCPTAGCWCCDARRGLLALDPRDGAVEELTTLVDGRPMEFCNNAAVHSGGDIWFSDSSRRYGIDRWKADLVENTASGRLLRRSPDGAVEVVLDGLRFANGVALAADESYVAVAETGGRTVVRHWLTGPRRGDGPARHRPAGLPDNIAGQRRARLGDRRLAHGPVVERIMTAPMPVRRLAWRVPTRCSPGPGGPCG